MPLPSPREREAEQAFIGRCMADEVMRRDFPDGEQRAAVCYAQWQQYEAGGKAMAFTHNSELAADEPRWGTVDKGKLPLRAFVWDAPDTDEDMVSTWSYPHHWVSDGGEPDENDRYTTGTLWLHEEGLNAAWAAANGTRSGEQADKAVLDHLEAHRSALGKAVNVRKSRKSFDERLIRKGIRRQVALDGPVLKAKAATEDAPNGLLEGYMCQYGYLDPQREMFVKGCFAKSIQEQIPAGNVPLMTVHLAHGGDVDHVIGLVVGAKEESYGPRAIAEFSAIQRAQDARTLVNEGSVKRSSVGFYPIPDACEWGKDSDGDFLMFHEAKLADWTITLNPVQFGAVLTGCKSFDGLDRQLGEFLDFVSELRAGLSSDALRAKDTRESARGRVFEVFGGRSRVELLAEHAKALGGLVDDLLEERPQDTGVKPADLHRMKLEIERCRIEMAKMTL